MDNYSGQQPDRRHYRRSFALAQASQKRRYELQDKAKAAKDKQASDNDVEQKALRYIMLYIIQERCKEHIAGREITLEERRALHHWHDLYHDGLGGNGDADALMRQMDDLPVAAN